MNYKGKYLIVAGTNKAGTTSLYNYLSYHQQIIPAAKKQTDYFLHPAYPLIKSSKKTKVKSFLQHFQLDSLDNKNNYLMDVSPDYMYDKSVIDSIKSELDANHIKLLFILRDPIERLISWFQYGKQIGELNQEVNFEEYLALQEEKLENHITYCAQKTGKYAEFIQPFFDNFPRENIHICFFETLKNEPSLLMNELCDFLKINSEVYKNYNFTISNKTVKVKSKYFNNLYKHVRGTVVNSLEKYPKIFNLVKKPGQQVTKLYKKLNTETKSGFQLSKEQEKKLIDYYEADVKKIEKLIEHKTPWTRFNA